MRKCNTWNDNLFYVYKNKTPRAVMVERKSSFISLERLLRKTSQQFSDAIHARLFDFSRHLRIIITNEKVLKILIIKLQMPFY